MVSTLRSLLSSVFYKLCHLLSFLAGTRLRLEELDVPVDSLPASLRGLKIVHLSDFHWDHRPIRITASMMDSVVEMTNAVEPDLILLTGDFVQFDPEPAEELAQRWLSKLKSKRGIFAVLGNHDYKRTHSKGLVTEALQRVGIRVLSNESTLVEGLEDLEIVGFGDLFSGEFRPEAALPQSPADDHNKTRIALSHNPDTARRLSQWRVNLTLSGHTHGGQIALPFVGPLIPQIAKVLSALPRALQSALPKKLRSTIFGVVSRWEWAAGLHRIPRMAPLEGGNMLYTSRGLATHPPLRLFCDPEVAALTLVAGHS